MCGLPGQDEESWKQTVLETAELKPDMVRIAPTIVLKNTPLEKLYHRGIYQPLSLETAIEQTSYAYRVFVQHKITILRVGLALSDDNGDGSEKIVAGPWHPSLRHEVESRLAGDILTGALSLSNRSHLCIHPKDISIVAGPKKRNLTHWKNRNIHPLSVKRDDKVPRHHYRLETDSFKPLFY